MPFILAALGIGAIFIVGDAIESAGEGVDQAGTGALKVAAAGVVVGLTLVGLQRAGVLR